MTVRVYDGNSATVLNSWIGVKAVSIQSNGAITLQCPVIGLEGTQMVQVDPAANKITIERAFNEE